MNWHRSVKHRVDLEGGQNLFDRKGVKTSLKPVKTGFNRSKLVKTWSIFNKTWKYYKHVKGCKEATFIWCKDLY